MYLEGAGPAFTLPMRARGFTRAGGLGALADDPNFYALPRSMQRRVESGEWTLETAVAKARNQGVFGSELPAHMRPPPASSPPPPSKTAGGSRSAAATATPSSSPPPPSSSAPSSSAEPDCKQPVSTAERDAIRDELKFALDYKGQGQPGNRGIHWHEGHPDIKAWFEDIIPRIDGLYERPKLLRCSAGARKRAGIWVGQVRDMLSRVKKPGGFTSVDATFQAPIHRGPTYTIRASSDPDIQRAIHGRGSAGPTQSSHPAGSVVVGGQAYQSSAQARAAGVTPEQASLDFDARGGTIAGIPTSYLLIGAAALAFFAMKK